MSSRALEELIQLRDPASNSTPHPTTWRRYFFSCGLLLLPIFAWNAAFTRFLPPAFAATVKPGGLIEIGEQLSRAGVLALPFLMPLDIWSRHQRLGLSLVALGTVAYFLSWLPLMLAPRMGWSTSLVGMLAPAATPLLWLIGIGLTGSNLFWPSPYRRWHYLALSFVFVACHLRGVSLIVPT